MLYSTRSSSRLLKLERFCGRAADRFYNDGSWKKRFTAVDYNLNELNLERVAKSHEPGYTRFRLYAVSNHYGSMNGGHYTAYCRNVEFNRWFKFDDCNVMELMGNEVGITRHFPFWGPPLTFLFLGFVSQVRSSNAYILFYSAIDCRVSSTL